jgi:hypothetical protein
VILDDDGFLEKRSDVVVVVGELIVGDQERGMMPSSVVAAH